MPTAKIPSATARKLAGRRRWMRYPIVPGGALTHYPNPEAQNTKPLDFEDRDNVDWSGYYQNEEKATDNE